MPDFVTSGQGHRTARRAPRLDRFGEPIQPTLRLVPIADHERALECNRCHELVVIGGWVDDLDPNTYVCIGCRLP